MPFKASFNICGHFNICHFQYEFHNKFVEMNRLISQFHKHTATYYKMQIEQIYIYIFIFFWHKINIITNLLVSVSDQLRDIHLKRN